MPQVSGPGDMSLVDAGFMSKPLHPIFRSGGGMGGGGGDGAGSTLDSQQPFADFSYEAHSSPTAVGAEGALSTFPGTSAVGVLPQ